MSAYQDYLERLQSAQQRQGALRRLRPEPGDEGLMALLEGLARIYGGGASLAMTGQANPLDAVRGIVGGARQAKQNAMTGQGDPLETGMSLIPARGALSPRGRALHGEEVKAQLLAKRAAKGPRKPGGGRRPKAQVVPEVVEPEQDLTALLAQTLAQKGIAPRVAAPVATPARGGLKSLLFKLGRNR